MLMERMDIGIIGGSDGPTSIVITSRGPEWYEIAAIILVAAVVAVLIIRAIIKHNRYR